MSQSDKVKHQKTVLYILTRSNVLKFINTKLLLAVLLKLKLEA